MRRAISTARLLAPEFQRLTVGAKALYMTLFCSADDYGIVDNVYRVIGVNKYISTNLDDLVKAGYIIVGGDDSALVADFFLQNGSFPQVDVSRQSVYDDTTIVDRRFVSLHRPKTKKRAAFVPPTLEEIRAYAKERGSVVDPVAFYTYYNTPNENGETWVTSMGKPVANWKGTFVTWEKNRKLKGVSANGRSDNRIPQQVPEGNPRRVSERYNLSAAVDGRRES